jgi:hypothetical protein
VGDVFYRGSQDIPERVVGPFAIIDRHVGRHLYRDHHAHDRRDSDANRLRIRPISRASYGEFHNVLMVRGGVYSGFFPSTLGHIGRG